MNATSASTIGTGVGAGLAMSSARLKSKAISAGDGLSPSAIHTIDDTTWSHSARATVAGATRATVRFVELSPEEWGTPEHVNQTRFREVLAGGSYYGNTEAYRRMCRFFSGPVFLTEALRGYDFAWRMDSHVRYLCDVPAPDPLDRMDAAGAVYGYALHMTEHLYTVPTLWETVREFADGRGLSAHLDSAWRIPPGHRMDKVCHYWNNLEVVRLDFFRAEPYQALFRHLDAAGGFFYERWGDAPVRTFALMLLARPEQVLQFEDVAYQHPWWFKCPAQGQCRVAGKDAECRPDGAIQPHNPTDGKMCAIGT